jgi:hypothetical protein
MSDYVVTCNECGRGLTITSNTEMDAFAQVELAMDLGWFRVGGKLHCPDHGFRAAQQIRLIRFTERGTLTFVCPDCWMVTPDPEDVNYCYCPNCHAFKYDFPILDPRCMEPTCPDFGDRSFGEGTCPAEHAVPPARRR